MPSKSLVLLISTFTASIAYLLSYYRRKGKRVEFVQKEHIVCDHLEQTFTVSETCKPIELVTPSIVHFNAITSKSDIVLDTTLTPSVNTAMSIGSETDGVVTPDSSEFASSPDNRIFLNLPPDGFNNPQYDIYESNPEELGGKILPKVLIPSDIWAEAVDQDIWHETFYIPSYMGGVLIGRLGKYLPLGEPVEILIRSLYGAKELFVTIPDDEYNKYLEMQSELDIDYNEIKSFRIQLCEPVTSGTIAVVPHSQGFARALIISVYQTWPKTVFYFLLDHGTFGVIPLNKLRKIRAKYMSVLFQAIHVSWAHAFPVFSDIPDLHLLRTFFNSKSICAFAVRMETCCRSAVCFGEPYSSNGILDTLVTACNSGLFNVIPLVLYSKRQCWLNDTDVPYYPFTYSAIDYQSLVSFVIEDDDVSYLDGDKSAKGVRKSKFSQKNFVNLNRNSDTGFRKNWNNTNGGRRKNNDNFENSKFNLQKENVYNPQGRSNSLINNMSKKMNFHNSKSARQPLGSRNYRSALTMNNSKIVSSNQTHTTNNLLF